MTLDDGTRELERLFAAVERSPFKAGNVPRVFNELAPEAAEQIGIVDVLADLESVIAAGGLVNGSFESGPPDEDNIIDTGENDLNGWTYVEVQGTWEVTWTVDANAPMGYSLVATQASASASDEFYLEQIIPASYYRRLVTAVKSSASDANMQLKVAVAFLDEAGAEVGSTQTGTFAGTTAATDRLWREPPALAVEARIRFGALNVAGTASQTRTILFISVDDPQLYSVEITGVYSYLSPAISTDYPMSYPTDVIPAGVYKADTEGFVVGIQAKTNDAISAGTIITRVENDTQATTPGPEVTLQNGTLAAVATASLDGATTPHFAEDDELHLELSADGDLSTTGLADYWGSCRLLLFVNDEGDW